MSEQRWTEETAHLVARTIAGATGDEPGLWGGVAFEVLTALAEAGLLVTPSIPDGPRTDGDLLAGCPVEVWDGPYVYRCAMGAKVNRCSQHGPFTPAKRCAVTPGCRRPERHGGRCNPLTATDATGEVHSGG